MTTVTTGGDGRIARRGTVSVRLLTDTDDDVVLMASWLSDPRVLEWFEGRDKPYDVDQVRAHYSSASLTDEAVTGCIIEDDGVPAGYIQFFPVDRYATEYGFDDATDLADVWACDMFVGDADRWGRGIGSASLGAVLDHLFVHKAARSVLIDPRVVNERAVHLYEKAGFRRIKVLPGHEYHEGQTWDNWLMQLDSLDHAVGLTAALARIDSVNPSLTPGAAGEGAVASFVAHWCTARGLEVFQTEVAPGRHNVVAVRRGRGSGRSIILNGHMDTVGITDADTMHVRLVDGRLEGRGVLDTKGGLAAALLAAASVAQGELAGDVVVAAVVDEEYGSIGTEALVQHWTADAAIVLEPTDLAIVSEHRGFAVLSAVFHGRSSHTSRPDRGANAVHAAARAVIGVAALNDDWAAGHPAGRQPSALSSAVASTGETFTVPARSELTVELRTTADDPSGQVQQATAVIVAAADDTVVHTDVVLTRPPMHVGSDHSLVRTLADALSSTGVVVEVTGAPYWTDAALHAQAGTPAVVFGPAGEGLHEINEWVTTDSLVRCATTLQRFVRSWCA